MAQQPLSPFGQEHLALLKDAAAEPAVVYPDVEICTALALVGAGPGVTLDREKQPQRCRFPACGRHPCGHRGHACG